MNGDTIAWILVERAHADDPHPEDGVSIPRHAAFRTREEADEAAVEVAQRVVDPNRQVVVAEVVDRRS